MSKKKKYNFHICKDCEKDFLAQPTSYNRAAYCPLCGDNIYTELVMSLWIERPFQARRPWTPDEDELITVGRKNGYSYQDIAAELQGRTYKATQRRGQRLGKGIRLPWTQEDNNKIREAAARGLTYREIYEYFKDDRTEQAVRRQCTRIVGGKKREGGENGKRKTAV